MKITKVEPILCDGGRWPWGFVKIQTDEGIMGNEECSDNYPLDVAGCINDLENVLLGQDPRPVGKLY